MKPRRWTLGGICEWRERASGAVLILLMAGNIAAGGLNVVLEQLPRFAARTDREGHTDVVMLPDREVAGSQEAVRFVEEVSLRLFSWDETTRPSDLEYVKERATSRALRLLPEVVPGYGEATKGVSGRVDVEIQTTRVLTDELPFRVEVQVAIEFLGSYMPPGVGLKDPANPRREVYGFLFTLVNAPRTPATPAGLKFDAIARVAMTGGES